MVEVNQIEIECNDTESDDELIVFKHIFQAGNEVLSLKEVMQECLIYDQEGCQWNFYRRDNFWERRHLNIRTIDKVPQRFLVQFTSWFEERYDELKRIHPTIEMVKLGVLPIGVEGLQRVRLLSTCCAWEGYKWDVIHGPLIKFSKNINITKDICWSLGDPCNILDDNVNRSEGGLNFKVHNHEVQYIHYRQIFMRFALNRSRHYDVGCFYKGDEMFTGIEQYGGTLMDSEYHLDFVARFAFFTGAYAARSKRYLKLKERINYYKDRKIHRKWVCLLLHRHGIYEKDIHKHIIQQSRLI